ncbi:MAG: 4-hydroxy-3-methylbut-2-enyl diphosphate reductase, partial [Thermus sp.]
AQSVGITSAASAPEDLVQELVGLLQARNPGLEVIEEGEEEDIAFRQPRILSPEEVLQGV